MDSLDNIVCVLDALEDKKVTVLGKDIVEGYLFINWRFCHYSVTDLIKTQKIIRFQTVDVGRINVGRKTLIILR